MPIPLACWRAGAPHRSARWSHDGWILHPYACPFSRWKYLRPHVQYITVSDAVRQVLTGSGIPPERIATVHSGIDLQRFHGVQEAPPLFPAGTRVIGTVGHLADHKGHRYLVEATALLARQEPDVRVVIAGDGELRRPWRRRQRR